MSDLSVSIDDRTAEKIATRFLEQHYSVIITRSSLEGNCWLVTAKVGFLPEQIKRVKIDAKNGNIIEIN
jgi:hypothetical protein